MPDGDEYLTDPTVRNKDRQFPYEPPPMISPRDVGGVQYIPPPEMAALDFVPFGADGLGHPGYRPDPPPPLPAAQADLIEAQAADILLDRVVDDVPPEAPMPTPDPAVVRKQWIDHLQGRPKVESLAERLRREARETADKKALELAQRQVMLEQQGLDAYARAARLFDQLRSLEGMWLGNVPHLAWGAGSATRLDRYRGQVVVRTRTDAWDHSRLKYVKHGVGVVLRHPNTVSMRLIDWATGWVNPVDNHTGNRYHANGWVIDDYNVAMSDKPPILAGQKPRTEEAAIEMTMDLLRKFVLPEQPPDPPPAEPAGTRPGLDL